MKKFFLLAMMFALILMTGCNLNDDKIKVGTIKYLNVTEDALDDTLVKHMVNRPVVKHIFFENVSSLIAGLESGQIDEMSIYRTVALYLSNNNPEFDWEISEPIVSDMFCCAMKESNDALRKEFDDAILTISKDGRLAKLVKTYINEYTRGDVPEPVELPTFYGAPTIKIGVTGDLPLLDYIRPDGEPAGFNTAVLAEISRILGKNFVLVQIDSGARSAALASEQVDVIFWAVSPKSADVLPKNFDSPEGVILTVPYFSDDIVHVKLGKKNE